MISIRTWVLPLVLVGGCIQVRFGPTQLAHADLHRILVAAADSVLTNGSAPVLYAVDTATVNALSAVALRLGRTISLPSGQVWCEDRSHAGRTVGTVVALAVDSVTGPRAVVRWSSTCLMSTDGAMAPSSFGEGGTYEVARHDGRWRVSRTLTRFSY